MSDFSQSEYQALRATIRERGTARVCGVLAGIGLWGLLAGALQAAGLHGGLGLVPLTVLAATFEINFFVHTGVERIGRYIQVFYEEAAGAAGWETTAMNYGAKFPGAADPLFGVVFSICAAVNFFSSHAMLVGFLSSTAMRSGQLGWMALSLIVHLGFAYRIVTARKLAAGQRAADLDRFRNLISK